MTVRSDDYRSQGARRKLVQELRTKGIHAPAVLDAIGLVPRHLFFEDSALRLHAYEDKAFPIGCGQTISQPYTVAFQTQLLEVRRGDRVLEVGTGSGYQTAVLAAMGAKVWSVERHRPLFLTTRARLGSMGYRAALTTATGSKVFRPTHRTIASWSLVVLRSFQSRWWNSCASAVPWSFPWGRARCSAWSGSDGWRTIRLAARSTATSGSYRCSPTASSRRTTVLPA